MRRLLIPYRRAKHHAVIAAVIGWVAVAAFIALGTDDRSIFGPLKWGDFVHFYTLGNIARTRQGGLLYDAAAQHARQVELVPASAPDGFIPVYGPQTALVFAPLSLFPYLAAGMMWGVATLGVYAFALITAWRPARHVFPDRLFVVAAALAFPPVWQLMIYGQTTAIVLLAFALAWSALERDRPVWAGFALSLLSIKPQFAIVLGALAIVTGEWKVIAGGILGIGLQVGAVMAIFDASVLKAYAEVLRHVPSDIGRLEPAPYKMHAVRALTSVLPRFGWTVWALCAVAIIAFAIRVWQLNVSWRLKFGFAVFASVLVNPHLTIYDVTVLALPIVWIGGWLLEEESDTTWFWQFVYWIYVALLFPTAVVVPVQLSTVLMLVLFVKVFGEIRGVRAGSELRSR
jgi:hypothetical protein